MSLGAALVVCPAARAAANQPAWSYPIAFPDQLPGDGLYIKHGYASENAESYPGLLHTGENWYGISRNATEANVIAASDGEVAYADFDYPGRVVIIQHESELFSMYGHLDYDLAVEPGQRLERGDRIGSPLSYPGDHNRSHLHFEIRRFYTQDLINGDHPSHGFTCGYRCPPGPGYWPIDAPEHPSDLGWLNPTHVIAEGAFPESPQAAKAHVVVQSEPSRKFAETWSLPSDNSSAERVGPLELTPGTFYPLVQIAHGATDSHGRNAEAYRLWYRIELPDGERIWVQSAVPSFEAEGLDGGPSSIRLDLLPDTTSGD